MPKRIALLGSTGSIGRSTLEVVRRLGPEYEIFALAANTSWERLADQALEFKPQCVAMSDAAAANRLRERLHGKPIRVLEGQQGCTEIAAAHQVDVVVAAMVGAAGLLPTIEALRAGKTLALANKEPMVMAGHLISALARENDAAVLPVDSEHSAIFQAMQAGRREDVRRVVITASGGPLRARSADELRKVTPEQALVHPIWRMGDKITIDSATLMNKALEVIEAKWLFGLRAEQIEVVVHPQSIVHSLVEFCDGSVIAQMSQPDMKMPIHYALTYPERRPAQVEPLDLARLGQLTFHEPDYERFPALRLGFAVAEQGGTSGAVLNAANEVAVREFLAGRIEFTQIVELTAAAVSRRQVTANPSIETVLAVDRQVRLEVMECLSKS